MIKEIEGDLVYMAKNGEFDVIVQGCNCFNTMGAGIAKQIKNTFPDAYQADLRTPKGDPEKLGTYSKGIHYSYNKNKYVTIVNAYTQFNYKVDDDGEPPVDYDAIEKALIGVNNEFKWQSIGLPLIGCGLAGGDWERVRTIIEKTLTDVDVTIVHFKN